MLRTSLLMLVLWLIRSSSRNQQPSSWTGQGRPNVQPHHGRSHLFVGKLATNEQALSGRAQKGRYVLNKTGDHSKNLVRQERNDRASRRGAYPNPP